MRVHADKRSQWAQGFTPAAIDGYNVFLTARAKQLADKLADLVKQNKTVDLGDWVTYFSYVVRSCPRCSSYLTLYTCSFDFMGDLLFGGGFTMLQDGGDPAGIATVLKGSGR